MTANNGYKTRRNGYTLARNFVCEIHTQRYWRNLISVFIAITYLPSNMYVFSKRNRPTYKSLERNIKVRVPRCIIFAFKVMGSSAIWSPMEEITATVGSYKISKLYMNFLPFPSVTFLSYMLFVLLQEYSVSSKYSECGIWGSRI
jgi:hypothetical protein